MRPLPLIPLALLAACATPAPPPPSAEIVRIQEKLVPIQQPCPVTVPRKPAPLSRPLPHDSIQLAALLAGKLLEWAGPGGYGERADAALRVCTMPTPDPMPTP